MNRISKTLGRRDMLFASKVWPHRRGHRYVHHGRNGRTHRANVYRLRALA